MNIILNFIKNEKFTPFEDAGIKTWHIAAVNTKKDTSIIQKCQNALKPFISGTYCLGERMNKSWKHIKMSQSLERHRVLLKSSVLLYILNSVEIKFTYKDKDKDQYAILCKNCHYEYLKEDNTSKTFITNSDFLYSS